MGLRNYFNDLVWTTVLFAAVLASVLIEYLPYILSGTTLSLSELVHRAAEESLSSVYGFVNYIILGDLAVFMYAVVAVLTVARRLGRAPGSLPRELGFSFRIGGPWELAAALVLSMVWIFLVVPVLLITRLEVYSVVYSLYPVAISEEVLFRGIMLGRLIPGGVDLGNYRAVPRALPAVLLSSAYFTLAHVPFYIVQGSVPELPLVFLYGVISGLIYVLTGGVVVDVALHWFTDYLAFMALG